MLKQQRKCYETHRALAIPVKDEVYYIYGGSCYAPVIGNADIYVGLDFCMNMDNYLPWKVSGCVAFKYLIIDYMAPHNAEDFLQLIAWLAYQILNGKIVHVGCIGGHGRTGTVLAALYSYMTGDRNAIQYVRTNYCMKAVESAAQITFLQKHFKCTPVKPSKIRGLDFPKKKKKKKKTGTLIMPNTGSIDNIWGVSC